MRIVLLFLSLLSAQVACTQEMKDYYNKIAIDFVYNNQFDSAIVYFSKVIELSPTDEIAFLDRGLAYEKQHQLYEALHDFSKQQEIDSTMPDAGFLKGILLEQLGDTVAALKEYLKVTELDFYNSDAHFYAGRCYEQMKDLVSADSCYSRALRGNPYNLRVIPFYILCKLNQKHTSGLAELVAKLPSEYEDPNIPFSLGAFAYYSRNYAEANRQFKRAIGLGYFSNWTLNQTHTETFTNKQFLKILENDWSKSKELKDQLNILQTAILTGNWKFAEKHLKTIEPLVTSIDFYRLNAIIAVHRGNLKSGLSWWEKTVVIESHIPNDEYSIALVYQYLKQTEKACEWYNSYLKHTSEPVAYQLYPLCHAPH